MQPSDNENWLIDTGHDILEKKAEQGPESLEPIERLIRAWWVADYGMRNAGDLQAAFDLDPQFLDDGLSLASDLELPTTKRAFADGRQSLEATFFKQFESICDELRGAYGR